MPEWNEHAHASRMHKCGIDSTCAICSSKRTMQLTLLQAVGLDCVHHLDLQLNWLYKKRGTKDADTQKQVVHSCSRI